MNQRIYFFAAFAVLILAITYSAGTHVYKATQTERNEKGLLHSHDYEKPPEVTETGPQPKAVADSMLFNFGRMSKNQTQKHSFTVKNEGEAPLILTVGDSSCKCTLGSISDKELDPGESTSVDLEWTPTKPTNSFRQYATIQTNDPNSQEIVFAVEGQVFETFEISPDETWKAGEMTPGETRTIKGRLTSKTVEEFNITKIISDSKFVSGVSTPLSAEEKEASQIASGHEVELTIAPGFSFGKFVANARLYSDYEEDRPFNIHVEGFIKGPFTFLKATKIKGVTWSAAAMQLNMGRFSSAKGREVTMKVYVADIDRIPDDKPLEIEAIESDFKFLNVDYKILENNKETGRALVEMVFKLQPDAPPITKSADRPAIIRVKSNHPDAPDFPMFVAFAAE